MRPAHRQKTGSIRLPKVASQMLAVTASVLRDSHYRTCSSTEEQALNIVIAICADIHSPHKIYVPSGGSIERYIDIARRDQKIRDLFRGNNIDALARAYGLSPRQIRRIVASPPIHWLRT